MESRRDINRVMEREIVKGSCPLKLDHIEFGDYSYRGDYVKREIDGGAIVFVEDAAKRGISVETLKYLMGHTDISVTSNVYTHLKLEDAQREMERLERIEKEMKKCAK